MRQADGVLALNCVESERLRGGFKVAEVEIRNRCGSTIQTVGSCLKGSAQVQADCPFRGAYILQHLLDNDLDGG
jgi:hypothetical protein